MFENGVCRYSHMPRNELCVFVAASAAVFM
jgi:hypothetical protein